MDLSTFPLNPILHTQYSHPAVSFPYKAIARTRPISATWQLMMESSSEQQSSDSGFVEEITERVTANLAEKIKKTKQRLKAQIQELKLALEDQKRQGNETNTELEAVKNTIIAAETEKQKQKSVFSNHLTSVSEVSLKIDKFSEDINFIRTSLSDLTAEMSLKSSVKDISRLSDKISTLCPLHYAQSLELELKLKAPMGSLIEHEKRLDAAISEIRGQYAKKEQTHQELQLLDEKLEAGLSRCVTSQYFSRITLEMQKTSEFLRHKIEESTGELRRRGVGMREELEQMRKDVDAKASVAMYQDLKRIVNTCASVTQVETLAGQVLGFGKSIEGFRAHLGGSLEAQDKVLQRYDELILEKASKVDFKELDMRLKAISRHIDFERRVDSMELQINSFLTLAKQHTVDVSSLSSQVDSFSKTIQNVKSEKREIAMLKSTLQDLMETIGTKADKTLISELRDHKAGAEEVARISKSLEVMFRIDKLTVVLLQHTIKYLNSVTEYKAVEYGSVEWLLKHADLVAGWMQIYEPTREDDIPTELYKLIQPHKVMASRTPTAPSMRTPVSAGLALLTPTKKSRPVTPSYHSTGKIAISLVSSRSVPRRSNMREPPSLDGSLFRS